MGGVDSDQDLRLRLIIRFGYIFCQINQITYIHCLIMLILIQTKQINLSQGVVLLKPVTRERYFTFRRRTELCVLETRRFQWERCEVTWQYETMYQVLNDLHPTRKAFFGTRKRKPRFSDAHVSFDTRLSLWHYCLKINVKVLLWNKCLCTVVGYTVSSFLPYLQFHFVT